MRIPTLSALTAAAALSATALLGPAGAALAADGDDDGYGGGTGAARGRGVLVQPQEIAPGGEFSVFDGGNCTKEKGTASFTAPPGGTRLPDLGLGPLSNMVGGTGTLPRDTEPGNYRVSVTCGDEGPFSGGFTVTGDRTGGDETDGTGSPSPGARLTGAPGEKEREPAPEPEHEQAPREKPAEPGEAGEPGEPGATDEPGDGGAGQPPAPRPTGSAAATHGPGAGPAPAGPSPAPKGGVETGVGGSTMADGTTWGLGGAAVLALIGGALWYRRHGRI
ncbi:hypothetical protein V1J52_18565 [Streptomyces sp. TRM 70351]|uniref:hypothetical protein n=1 Tax=Streptomyces sp. TRM 70351 TaxID=3116552 RepID=UPI002E7B0090|nr:hypothetical protein [Streptomyces sp. TRM 70351]MEE1930165.1 hypothetical protein [Streptomyces sp. TRM 70351]